MGLGSSQCRMLALTRRLNSVENQLMHNSNERLALSRESTEISEEYASAMNATKVVYGTTSDYSDLSYSLFNSESSDYVLTSATGAVLVSDSDAASWGLNASATNMTLDETTFLEKASGLDAGVVTSYLTSGTTSTTSTGSTGSTASPAFAFQYNTSDVFTQMTGYTITGSDNKTVVLSTNPNVSAVVTASDHNSSGQSGDAYNVGVIAGEVCSDTGTALTSVLKSKYSSTWSSMSTSVEQAIALATNATKQYYESQVTSGAIYKGACEEEYGHDAENALNSKKGSSCRIFYATSPHSSYLDATAMSKYFLSMFNIYANAISTGKLTQSQLESNAYFGSASGTTLTAAYGTGSSDSIYTNDVTEYNNNLNNSNNSMQIISDNSSLETTASTTSSTTGSSANTTLAYYAALWNEMKTYGYKVNDNITDSDYLSDQIESGNIVIRDASDWTKESVGDASSDFVTVDDDEAATKAEAEYEAAKDKIDYKETILDTEKDNLDTERSAINTEMESVQKIIDSNVKTLKLFQNA